MEIHFQKSRDAADHSTDCRCRDHDDDRVDCKRKRCFDGKRRGHDRACIQTCIRDHREVSGLKDKSQRKSCKDQRHTARKYFKEVTFRLQRSQKQVVDRCHRFFTDCEDDCHRQGNGDPECTEQSYDGKFLIHSRHLRSALWNLLLHRACKDQARSPMSSSHPRYVRRSGLHA